MVEIHEVTQAIFDELLITCEKWSAKLMTLIKHCEC